MLLLVPLEHKIPNDQTCVDHCYPSKLNTTACPPDLISILFVLLSSFIFNIFFLLNINIWHNHKAWLTDLNSGTLSVGVALISEGEDTSLVEGSRTLVVTAAASKPISSNLLYVCRFRWTWTLNTRTLSPIAIRNVIVEILVHP